MQKLEKGKLAQENFWISMPVSQADAYEPVGVAGTAYEGNKDAYLKRFGISHGILGYISEPPAPSNPLPEINYNQASTNYNSKQQKPSVRLTRLDLVNNNSNNINQLDDETDTEAYGQQPVGWTTTDSGRRIIVPESMLTRLGSQDRVETKVTSVSETRGTKKNKRRLDKKLKIEAEHYEVNESRPSSIEDDYHQDDDKAILKKKEKKFRDIGPAPPPVPPPIKLDKASLEKHEQIYTTISTRNANKLNEDEDNFEAILNEYSYGTNVAKREADEFESSYALVKSSVSKLAEVDEYTMYGDEKRLQSIIKENASGEIGKGTLKVSKKVTYNLTESKQSDPDPQNFLDELDEHLREDTTATKSEKKKKRSKKHKSKKKNTAETEAANDDSGED